jgi:hypothetical protein
MADPNVKQIKLTMGGGATGLQEEGGAAAGTRKRGHGSGGGGRRRTAKKKFEVTTSKEGGGGTSPGTMTQLAASHNPGDPRLPAPVGVNSPLTQQGAPLLTTGGSKAAASADSKAPADSKAAADSKAPADSKAHTPVKVVLAAAKKKSKVVLAAAKPVAPAAARPAKTRKVSAARKIRVSMSSLSKKIHKARTIRHDANKSTIDTIKKALQKAGLIKADSKAPETMLRQMYADFMTLKNRAL